MTVADNMHLGSYIERVKTGRQETLEGIFQAFSPPERAMETEGGDAERRRRQMLAIGRALMARPRCSSWTNPLWGFSPCCFPVV